MATTTGIPDLLTDYMTLRGINRSKLAEELGVSRSIVTQWMGGMRPGLRSCQRIAARTGLPVKAVLQAAGHVAPDLDEQRRYPEWLTEQLDQLTLVELAVVAEQAQGLLRLRAERTEGEETP